MSEYNNFELLLFAASEECCNKEAEDFLNIDAKDFSITKQQRKRMKQLMRKYTVTEKRRIPAVKWIAVACILSLSLLFTACVSITEIREAIKGFFLNWYDDFVSVGFGDEKKDKYDYEKIEFGDNVNNSASSSESTTASTSEEIPPPPTEIVRKAYATYLPGDYTSVVDFDGGFYYSVSYYEGSDYVFSLTQNIITHELQWANTKSQNIYTANINGFDAIVIENIDMNDIYIIVWQDNEYEYNIEGCFSNIQEIINVAEGVKLN